jgi:hypothetical protein
MKIAYWVLTALFCLMMAFSAFAYLSDVPKVVEGFLHLGYPDYFRHALGVAKILGVICLVVPVVPSTLREWAYAGFVFDLIAAVVSHFSSGDGAGTALAPLVPLLIVLGSQQLWHRTSAKAATA